MLAAGCWAEHDDGSLIFVEANEGGTVVYEIFDMNQDPPVSYRDAMPEQGFKDQFSWNPDDDFDDDDDDDDDVPNIRWTWHDKTLFPWDRVMRNFPAGARAVSADDQLSAAARVARSLRLRARSLADDPDYASRIDRVADIADQLGAAIRTLRR